MTETETALRGLHHVTAIAGDPQRNVDFYRTVLGLRLVKRTVNFDAPDTYHLYYGDAAGRPATLLTFFPWPGMPSGRAGSGLVTTTAFSVPPDSLGWWQRHFGELGIDAGFPHDRDGQEVLTLRDPDGLVLDLVATDGDVRSAWDGEGWVPIEHAVRGLYSVTMSVRSLDATTALVTDLLGMRPAGEFGARARFEMADGGAGTVVEVVADRGPAGRQAGGTVHHIAFRAPDRSTQELWRDQLMSSGVGVTEIIDRRYFTSVYFHDPSGILLEIATDPPGFLVDETLLELGRSLQLPPWLEPSREEIERALPPIRLDHTVPM